MKDVLFSLLLFMSFCSVYLTTTLAQAPDTAPSKPIVQTLPQSPSSDTSDSSPDDIIRILRKAKSFNVLIRLLKTTQLINQINAQLITIRSGGLTIFAPDDGSFSQLKAGFLNSLADNQKIELLQFHVLPTYVSSSNFDSLSNPVRTLAGDNPGRLQLNVTAYGNNVNISTGVVNATVTGVVYSDKVLAIYHVDKVLLPLDFFKPKPPAPAPSPAMAPKADNDNSSADARLGTSKDSAGACSLLNQFHKLLLGLELTVFPFLAELIQPIGFGFYWVEGALWEDSKRMSKNEEYDS
ncbi:Fasciclin-like arabinogalactan protein 11 [Glycine soja]|uniref:Fasciclin-like arabinogalactan protein 11 n=1 Tax=Glycine soja TaxID=3848 RepID=A0A445HM14_GLYSO|nr:Fasciclin-like arabinogalactan protein 11 [Glycine soja]